MAKIQAQTYPLTDGFVCAFFVFSINEDVDARRIKSRSGIRRLTDTAALPAVFDRQPQHRAPGSHGDAAEPRQGADRVRVCSSGYLLRGSRGSRTYSGGHILCRHLCGGAAVVPERPVIRPELPKNWAWNLCGTSAGRGLSGRAVVARRAFR
jgi:hypothetical protein